MNNVKETNPKEALGIAKVPLHNIPCGVLMELGLAMMEGGRKYGSHNYRDMGVRASTYYDACMRHLMSWWEGEDIDPDSGLSHIIKAMTCLLVVRDSMHMGNVVDDRPIQLPNKLDIKTLNEQAEKLIEKYPNCKEPFIQKEKFVAIPEWITNQEPITGYKLEKKYTAYFSHHIRGKKGNDATDQDMIDNRNDAIKVCNQIRKLLPNWDIYCPADHDDVIMKLYRNGDVTEDAILKADCQILENKDAVLFYCKDNFISGGMRVELNHTGIHNIPYMSFSEVNDWFKFALQKFAKDIETYG